ncbi:N-glycosylase/DNA lyase [Moesziomyces antarcticus]|uniref:Related to 8-oxoguanine DNA-glycosylase n=2 Tax=Pseudozyma antarctica TaxID=84753 RepID=A0A5C3FR63_PSEA2|nr:N-glycosylase/DNA lyase [Moesziomyces antarcticus]GAK64984.1 N-glycosylase/DNA lyase [Moesziomyces antarcticus]SPO46027.1 related to 8-oxoguanine DNA-glycosylase [Moesziomyces antarcticus]
MGSNGKLNKLDKLDKHDDPEHADFFGPRPPAGYAALRAAPSQILLPLTVSNKCGQAFRWRAHKVWVPAASGPSSGGWDEQIEWSLCLSDRVVLLRQDEHRGFLYHKTLLPASSAPNDDANAQTVRETERWLKDYCNLDVPLEALYAEWEAKDAVFARFATRFSGLRMLRQDPWECMCAFVCSSNNNIARIGQMVQNLCTHFSPPLLEHVYAAPPSTLGEDVEQGEVRIVYHPFPSPEALAKAGVEEKLRELGFGYRAKYLAKTAQMLCEQHGRGTTTKAGLADHLDESHWLYGIKSEEDISTPATPDSAGGSKDSKEVGRALKRARRSSAPNASNSSTPSAASEGEEQRFESVRSYLQHLRTLSYHSARQELIQFPGVGPKVADCILLMSLDQASSIPVDRHVFQFAEKWYRLRTKRYEEIADYFRALWGEYAGWAHSVLFTADLRSFATYNAAKKEEQIEDADKAFWGEPTATDVGGYPTPPSSQVKKEEEKLQAVHSPPRVAIPQLVPQSMQTEGATLAERIKARAKRKSRST